MGNTGILIGNDYFFRSPYLRESLLLLNNKEEYISLANIGYAYLWLSEIRLTQKRIKESVAFFQLAEKNWKEYAPGLLAKLEGQDKELKKYKNLIQEHEIEEIAKSFFIEKACLDETASTLENES